MILLPFSGAQPTWRDLPLAAFQSRMTQSGRCCGYGKVANAVVFSVIYFTYATG